MQDFGKWLRDARTSRRKTQTECAASIGMKLQQWNQLEKQVRMPERETLRRIADALDMSEIEVMEAAGYIAGQSDVPAEVVSYWQRAVRAGKETEMLKAWRATADLVASV